ncbi:MAG: NYN domain-containing protein [Patescibacteria group bacterium]
MVIKESYNYAFIDGQNLNLAIRGMGWKLDFKRFRVYLKEKYDVERAYYFIGYLDTNSVLYKSLQEAGYVLIFKPVLINKDNKVKGNCDAELVLHSMIEYSNYKKAVIVTGDGDFYCLVNYLKEQEKLKTVLVPNRHKYSSLLRKAGEGRYIAFMNELRPKLIYKKKRTP